MLTAEFIDGCKISNKTAIKEMGLSLKDVSGSVCIIVYFLIYVQFRLCNFLICIWFVLFIFLIYVQFGLCSFLIYIWFVLSIFLIYVQIFLCIFLIYVQFGLCNF